MNSSINHTTTLLHSNKMYKLPNCYAYYGYIMYELIARQYSAYIYYYILCESDIFLHLHKSVIDMWFMRKIFPPSEIKPPVLFFNIILLSDRRKQFTSTAAKIGQIVDQYYINYMRYLFKYMHNLQIDVRFLITLLPTIDPFLCINFFSDTLKSYVTKIDEKKDIHTRS